MPLRRMYCFVAVALAALCASDASGQNQFANFTTPPYALDNVQGEWINLETELIKPILVTSDGSSVVIANEPDNRLVVYDSTLAIQKADLVLGQGISAMAENPYADDEIWVSVRHQSAVMVVDTTRWAVTAVLRPPINPAGIGIAGGDTPGGMAFAEGKAFVAAGSTDALEVYDAVSKQHVATVPLQRPHNQMTPALARPYAVVMNPLLDFTEVYVLSQISGNQSVPLVNPAGPVDLVLDLNNFAGFSLPDFDVVTVDAGTHNVIDHTTEIGTVLLGMAFHPTTGKLIVANMNSKNGQFIGEGSFTGGKVVENRLTFATLGGTSHTYVVTEPPTTAAPIVMPTDVAIDGFGRVYTAGYGSANIGVFSATGAPLGIIATGRGPRGLAFDATADMMYCLNRADDTVWAFDVSSGTSLPTLPLHKVTLTDPTYTRIKEGRMIFLDPSNTGSGTTGCFSCHPDLRKDGLTWDLSKYFDTTEQHTYTNLPTWKDRKGPMVTQDLRSLEDVPPYHWRGEQTDLEAFNDAFVGLLKGTKLTPAKFSVFKDYVFSGVYPCNPRQQMNRNYSASAFQGAVDYQNVNSDGDENTIRTCADCHALPTGTDASITDVLLFSPQSPLVIKTAQLRGMWTKTFSLANADDVNPPNFGIGSVTVLPMTGTGFFHSGVVDDTAEFIDAFFPVLTSQQNTDMKQFMVEFDSGLAPATMYAEFLDQAGLATTQVPYMIDQANNSNCDLVMIGRLRISGSWTPVSLLWDSTPTGQVFLSETTPVTFTWAAIQGFASTADAELLVLGVPFWSGERVALDRDRDGMRNGDERAFPAGPLDPKNPDTDGDGQWDGYDPQPLQNPNSMMIAGAPTPSVPVEVFATANSIKITYTTDQLSPTRVEYGLTTAYGQFEGDPFPLLLNPPARRSNHWKHKHTVVLRLLADGQPYQFRIHTQGQNNQTAATPNMATTMFRADEFTPNVRVSTIQVSGVRSGGQVTYTGIVNVVDNAGLAVSNATVTARLTTYNGANIGTQTVLQGTTVGGIATIVFPAVTQTAGDNVVLDVPMTVSFMSAPVAGVVDANGVPFAWPEGPSETSITAP